jgi:hypothetical protein
METVYFTSISARCILPAHLPSSDVWHQFMDVETIPLHSSLTFVSPNIDVCFHFLLEVAEPPRVCLVGRFAHRVCANSCSVICGMFGVAANDDYL